jgi:hypothetical protein
MEYCVIARNHPQVDDEAISGWWGYLPTQRFPVSSTGQGFADFILSNSEGLAMTSSNNHKQVVHIFKKLVGQCPIL